MLRLLLAVALAGSCAAVARAPCESMILAAGRGDVALVEHFLAEGCDANFRDDEGFTAVCDAAAKGRVGVLAARSCGPAPP